MSVQVRINETTHRALKSIASEVGQSMQDVVERAVERYERDLFLEGLNDDFASLRENTPDWNSELEERELWNSTNLDSDLKSDEV